MVLLMLIAAAYGLGATSLSMTALLALTAVLMLNTCENPQGTNSLRIVCDHFIFHCVQHHPEQQ
jgi:hypothetical protein